MGDEKTLETIQEGVSAIRSTVGDIETSHEELRTEMARQAEQIANIEKERQEAAARVRTPWGSDGHDERKANPALSQHFSLTAAWQRYAHESGRGGFAAPDKDSLIRQGHFPDAVERAMSGKVLTDGGFLLPERYMPEIIAALLPRTIIGQLGAQMFQVGAGAGQIRWPKQNSRPTVTAVPEAGAPTESTPTWQSVVLTPKKAGMLMAIPNEVLKYSTSQTEQFLQGIILRELQVEMDTRALIGTGSANLPLGVVNMDSIQNPAIGANGGAITYNLILDLITQVEESNVSGQRYGFATSPRGLREIHQVVDSQNRPIFLPALQGLADARPGTLHGFPILTSTIIPTDVTKASGSNLTYLFFCDWNELLCPMWGNIEFRTSDQATDGTNNAWTQDLTLARGFVTYDVAAEHNEGLGVISDMNSA